MRRPRKALQRRYTRKSPGSALLPGVNLLFTFLIIACAAGRVFAVRHGMPAVSFPLGRALTLSRALLFPGELFSAGKGECPRAPLRRLSSHQALSRTGHGIHGISFVSSHDAPLNRSLFFSFSPGAARFQVGPIFCFVQWYHPFLCHFPFLGYIITHFSPFVNSKFQISAKFFYIFPPGAPISARQ